MPQVLLEALADDAQQEQEAEPDFYAFAAESAPSLLASRSMFNSSVAGRSKLRGSR